MSVSCGCCAQMRGSKGDITAYYLWPRVATARSLRWGQEGEDREGLVSVFTVLEFPPPPFSRAPGTK